MPGVVVNGSDVLEVLEVTKEAVDRARNGGGPTLIEAKTYRWKGHSRSDARKYRSREEERDWMENRDPIALFRKKLIDLGYLTSEKEDAILKRVENEIEEAVKFAENSPEPSIESLEEDVYA